MKQNLDSSSPQHTSATTPSVLGSVAGLTDAQINACYAKAERDSAEWGADFYVALREAADKLRPGAES